jgi:hypothetical protein
MEDPMRTALMLLALAPATALAGPVLDARVDVAAATRGDAPTLGTGVGARVGLPLDAKLVRIVPEAGLTLWTGSGLLVPDIGARASIGHGIEPGAYAHLLFPMPTPGGPARGWDAGARVDVTMLPAIDLGAHLGLTQLSGPAHGEASYINAGIDVGFTF